jgi:hypothetical protein
MGHSRRPHPPRNRWRCRRNRRRAAPVMRPGPSSAKNRIGLGLRSAPGGPLGTGSGCISGVTGPQFSLPSLSLSLFWLPELSVLPGSAEGQPVGIDPSQNRATGTGPRSTRRRSGPILEWKVRTRRRGPGRGILATRSHWVTVQAARTSYRDKGESHEAKHQG